MEPQNSIQKLLLERYIQGTASQVEVEQLFVWLKEHEPESIEGFEELLEASYIRAFEKNGQLDSNNSKRILEELVRRINNKSEKASVEFITHKRRRTKWYWAAASIIILLGMGIYFYVDNNKQQPTIAINTSKDIPAPATNRATITLSDASTVYLDSMGNGQLAQLGNITVVKLASGQIVYQTTDGQILQELQYNTLTNPRGSKVIDITLSDGSRVWLNAGSSIIYPVAFVGDERRVELKGEGYFEVAKDASKKFIVTANRTTTEVLGTHFNINAYEGEKAMEVTLLEGSVAISNSQNKAKVILRPGQQAALSKADPDIKISRPNLDQVLAWKNGFFAFNNLDFEEVMKKIERWYDVRVVYLNDVPKIKLGGDLHQNTSLNATLEVLRFQGANLKLEGRNVVVH